MERPSSWRSRRSATTTSRGLTLVFADKTVEVNFEMAIGFKTTLTGRTDD